MIYDRSDLNSIEKLQSDICVIGGGAAGISIGLHLINTTLDVSILESGGLDFDNETQRLNEGDNIGLKYFPLQSARLRFFGGSTNHWNGKCAPLFPHDFLARSSVPYSGWPINYMELLPYYKVAQKICGLGPYELYEDMESLGLPSLQFIPDISKTMLQYRIFQVSRPTRFGVEYREDLKKAKNVHIYLGANVLELLPNKSSTAIDSVKIRTLEGKDLTARSRFFVLAAGGIENPRILLASNSRMRHGLGNEHDIVGRFFMEHLLVFGAGKMATRLTPKTLDVFRTQRTPNQHWVKVDLGFNDEFLWKNSRTKMSFRPADIKPLNASSLNSANKLLELASEWQLPKDIKLHLRNLRAGKTVLASNAIRKALGWHLFERSSGPYEASLTASIEQLPNPNSRVLLSDKRDSIGMPQIKLDWHVGEKEYFDLRKNLELMALEVIRSGFGAVQILLKDYNDFLDRVVGQWHHMGTTRMSDDPKKGVVNADCRVHSLGNLYIAGSSVFPTVGESNPTLTICALAIRLASHLKSQFA
jgi:choline dehydrogenase-like flavoprotein